MKIVITVPGHLTCHDQVEAELHCLMKLAGGVTMCPAQGQWVAPDGRHIIEPVEQYHFCFIGPTAAHDWGRIDHAVCRVAMALFEAGEQAVLVEHYGAGYRCNLFTKEKFK